jgi:hypothetical protein
MTAKPKVFVFAPGEVLDNVYNQEVIEHWKARCGGKALI